MTPAQIAALRRAIADLLAIADEAATAAEAERTSVRRYRLHDDATRLRAVAERMRQTVVPVATTTEEESR